MRKFIESDHTFIPATREDLKSGQREFYHRTLRDSKGHPVRARINGKMQEWKRQPNKFKQPMMYGTHKFFYITEDNLGEWCKTYMITEFM